MSLYADPAFQALTPDAWRPGGLELTRRGLTLCAWSPGALVADVGSGPGGTARALRDLGLRVLALDRIVRDETKPCVPEYTPVCADACRLPLAEASLDGIVCECVLSLLPDPQLAVAEFARVLRPGGKALVSDLTFMPCETAAGSSRAPSRSASSSCTDGALDPQLMAIGFVDAGLRLLAVEDHRDAMRALAAKLVWHGIGYGCGRGYGGARSFGYHLWIVEKEGV